MKLINILPAFLIFLLSCNNGHKEPTKKSPETENKKVVPAEQTVFFPVTDFLKGQVAEIKNLAVNPIKITVQNKQVDSVWLKHENMDEAFSAFLTPVIDSTNLSGLFSENKFLDETIGAFTFTYDPVKPLPDSFLLQRWDVYVDQASNTVRRVYMIRKTADHKILQLTWQTKESCRIVTISTDEKGHDYVEKEVTIKWHF